MIRAHWMVLGVAIAATSPHPVAPAPLITQTTRIQIHMTEYLQGARDLQRAIAQGHLVNARALAAWFVSHPIEEQPGWHPYLAELRDASRQIAMAPDVATAGRQLGRLGAACESCHRAVGAIPTFTYAPPPQDTDEGLDAVMGRHQWAATRLWEGLIGPSEREWREGATVIAVDPVIVHEFMRAKPSANVVELSERLVQLARDAQTLHGDDARARLYGRMMTTCAGCHELVRADPVALGRDD